MHTDTIKVITGIRRCANHAYSLHFSFNIYWKQTLIMGLLDFLLKTDIDEIL